MRIEIIVPIIVDYLFPNLLKSIEANTVLPDRIILVDNTPSGFYPISDKIEITRIKSKTGKVNESWNLGIKNVSPKTDFVGIYNDDIVLNPYFFQRLIETFMWSNYCAVACPEVIPTDKPLKRGKVRRVQMKRKEGWCFTFRKKVLDLIPPIPNDKIVTFWGDDWYWRHTYRLGYFWGKDRGNPIWHHVGVSILMSDGRLMKRPDWWAWQEIKNNI